jgi:hypothetical protein
LIHATRKLPSGDRIHPKSTKNTKERGGAHSLGIIYGVVAMPTTTSSSAFVAFVSFVVSLRADLGAGQNAARRQATDH